MSKMLTLLATAMLTLMLAMLSTAAFAQTGQKVVVAVGVSGSTTTVLYDNDAASTCPYQRSFTDSKGRSGCWAPDNGYNRYVLLYRKPTANLGLLPYSQTVTCAPDTTDAATCLSGSL